MSDISATVIDLARDAVCCDYCFVDDGSQRGSRIKMAQPFSIGCDYWSSPLRVVVLGINPGTGKVANNKSARKDALERFKEGDECSLSKYFRATMEDVPFWAQGRLLDRLESLKLNLRDITIGNVALCATLGNRYPSRMLEACFVRHATRWLRELKPHAVVLMGSPTKPFLERVRTMVLPQGKAFTMLHFAHRKGDLDEKRERARVCDGFAELRATESR